MLDGADGHRRGPVGRPTAEQHPEDSVEGRLEGVIDGMVVGWVWSPRSPLERIWVSVFVDDEPVGLVAADLERADLLTVGFGDGAHGFEIELPTRLRSDGQQHTVRVMAGRSNTQLPAASAFIANVYTAGRSSNGAPSAAAIGREAAEANGSPTPAPPASSPWPAPLSGSSWRALLATELRRYGPQTALAVALVANLILLLVSARHLGFFQDDFLFILDKRGWSADTFLAAMNGHLSLLPVTVFKLLFLTVGLSHIWPYQVVIVAIDSACVIVLYILLARRAGRAIALIPAGLLLALGAGTGSIDLVWITQIGYLLSLTAGTAALVYLDRGERSGDRAAAALLAVSLASSGPSLAMCAGAAALLLATRAPLRRYWVVLGPLALYVLWYLGYGTQGVDIANLPKVPDYLVQIASTSCGALVGLSGPARTGGFGATLLMAGVAVLVLRTRRARPLPPLAIAGIAGALTFWILAALTRAQTDNAASVRYVYPSAVFILIAFGGLLSWRKLSARGVALVACALLMVGLGDLKVLNATVRLRTKLDDQVRVVLGAAEMIGSPGDPSFRPNPPFVPYLTLGAYLTAVHQLGSPALEPTRDRGPVTGQRSAGRPDDPGGRADRPVVSTAPGRGHCPDRGAERERHPLSEVFQGRELSDSDTDRARSFDRCGRACGPRAVSRARGPGHGDALCKAPGRRVSAAAVGRPPLDRRSARPWLSARCQSPAVACPPACNRTARDVSRMD